MNKINRFPLLVFSLLAIGHPAIAADDYAQANAHFRQGVVLFKQNDYGSAGREFREATKLNPQFGGAYFWVGVCNSQTKKTDEPIQAFQQALANTTDTKLLSAIHYDLGVQFRLRRY